MTHPSDIAGLSERLSDPRIDGAWYLRQEAKAALDSLSARVKELEAEGDAIADRCQQVYSQGLHEANQRVRRAEQQRDEAYERAAKVAECDISSSHYGIAARVRIARAIRRLASSPEGGAT